MTLQEDITTLQVFRLMAGPDREEVLGIIHKHEADDVAVLAQIAEKVARYIGELITEIRLEQKTA